MVQHRRGVVAGDGVKLHALASEREQLLVGPLRPGERLAPRLVGQRDGHVRADGARQRLDEVALEERQIVEAVEQHGSGAPARRLRAQHVERRDGVLGDVEAPVRP